MVGKAGVSPREHQDLARHSTYALTSRYSHSRFYDLAAAVQSLPIPMASGTERETLAATGTDGKRGETGSKNLGPNLGPSGDKRGDSVRLAETDVNPLSHAKTLENKPISASSRAFAENNSEHPQGDSNPCLLTENQTS